MPFVATPGAEAIALAPGASVQLPAWSVRDSYDEAA
jgi:hypothetical protein